jgi:hypothetical protein
MLSAGGAPQAGADLTIDAATITELLAVLTPERVQVPLPGAAPIAVSISDIKVTGFDPSGGANGKGHVLTSLVLRAPEIGLTLPVNPRLSLHVVEKEGQQLCVVRFHDVQLPVPVIGPVDISSALPTIQIPADHLYATSGARGGVRIRTRLVDVLMGTTGLRLRFDVNVLPGGP